MEERDRNFLIGGKINTLEKSLLQFGMPFLLEQLDINLELVRRGKETKENHLLFLKSFDKDLMKLSRTHHPDKAIQEKKSAEEVTNAQYMQTALNATRSVLKALTEVFLKDVDVHYKYEFFAKLDINTLISEKQIDLEINNVLCNISRLSEIKRVNIVGEIRKFLLKCQNCLESFRHDNKHDFVRHRDNALHHLHKCIEGYEILLLECKLIMEDCSAEKDENTRRVIQNMRKQSLREYKILLGLQEVAKRSLDGTFEIFPIYKPRYNDPMKPVEYEPVVPQELEYFVSPFIFYVDVLLMCSVMIIEKSPWIKFITKMENFRKGTFEYLMEYYPEESINFIKEPTLLKAYHLASYINNKSHHKEVQTILKEKGLTFDNSIIREVFNQTLEEIEQLLVKQFDINSYKEGKSNREQCNERLLELNDSLAEIKKVEKNLLEQFKLLEQETNEFRKECSELSEKIEQTDKKCQENIPKCENTIENVNKTCNQNNTGNGMFNQNNTHENESYADVKDNYIENKSAKNIEEYGKTEDHERKLGEHEKNLNLPICTENISNPMVHPLSSSDQNRYHPITKKMLIKNSKRNPQSIPSRLETSNDTAVTDKFRPNTQANNSTLNSISANETTNLTAQMIYDQCQDFPQEHDKTSKMDEKLCFSRV